MSDLDLTLRDTAPPDEIGCGMCGRPLTDPISRATGIGPVCHAKHHPRPGHRRPASPDQLALPAPETTMPIRQFTRTELAALSVPPDRPGEIKYDDHLLVDEQLTTLKYSALRRVVFRAEDGLTYAVKYEAPIDMGDYEVEGGASDNYGWYGPTVKAVQVEQRPVTVMQWLPVGEDQTR